MNMKITGFFMSVVMMGLFSCGSEDVNAQNQLVTQLEWKALIGKTHNPQIVDVRTSEEFNEGHLEEAVNIDFYENDFMEQMSVLDKDRPVFIYCQSGGRSGKASDKLFEAGYKQLYDLQGGYSHWEE
jgi:rhodanese-related sulfurtransferase